MRSEAGISVAKLHWDWEPWSRWAQWQARSVATPGTVPAEIPLIADPLSQYLNSVSLELIAYLIIFIHHNNEHISTCQYLIVPNISMYWYKSSLLTISPNVNTISHYLAIWTLFMISPLTTLQLSHYGYLSCHHWYCNCVNLHLTTPSLVSKESKIACDCGKLVTTGRMGWMSLQAEQ